MSQFCFEKTYLVFDNKKESIPSSKYQCNSWYAFNHSQKVISDFITSISWLGPIFCLPTIFGTNYDYPALQLGNTMHLATVSYIMVSTWYKTSLGPCLESQCWLQQVHLEIGIHVPMTQKETCSASYIHRISWKPSFILQISLSMQCDILPAHFDRLSLAKLDDNK